MNLTEKAAYLKGLADGLEYDKTTKEGKILAALLDLVQDITGEIADLHEDIDEIDEDLNTLNDAIEDLNDEMEELWEDEDEDEDEDDDFDFGFDDDDDYEDFAGCDGDCTNCDGMDCADEDYYEIVCPSCGETVCFDQELDPENLVCPACGEKFGCLVDEEDYKKLSEDEE